MATRDLDEVAHADEDRRLEEVAGRRLRVALLVTAAMCVVYFGFILLIAFDKSFLAKKLTDGLSLGILLGVVVIATTWILTWFYVAWANRSYEPEVRALGGSNR
jgi:uncharacterized membrane protein (DUF485 family)